MPKKFVFRKLFKCNSPTTLSSTSRARNLHEKSPSQVVPPTLGSPLPSNKSSPDDEESHGFRALLLKSTNENEFLKKNGTSTSQNETLQSQTQIFLTQNNQLTSDNKTLESEINRLREENEIISRKLNKLSHKPKFDTIQEVSIEDPELSEILKSQNDKLEKELKESRHKENEIQIRLDSIEKEAQTLKYELEKLLEERKVLEKDNKNCHEQIEQLTRENQQMVETRDLLNLEFGKLESEYGNLQTELLRLSNTNEALITDSINLKRENNTYQHEREALHDELNNVNMEIDALKSNHKSQSESKISNQVHTENSKEIINVNTNNTITIPTATIATLEQERETAKEQVKILSDHITELQMTGKQVIEQCEKLITDSNKYKEDFSRVNETNMQLKRENNSFKFDREALRQEILKAHERTEIVTGQLNAQLQDSKKRNNQLKKQITKLEQENEIIKEQKRNLLKENEQLVSENTDFREKYQKGMKNRGRVTRSNSALSAATVDTTNIPRYAKLSTEINQTNTFTCNW
ncbi:hypothetical protein G9A89_003976 [Geosiphon pyriformis]|nr:hypothetical protein G9A89_003976 [Geosiphon pyriformis]